ncbi:MAG: hypothetical protein NVV83_00140 [Afipia sp.]|jgi:hypothetical protein|nr:hypothetical protein [Afipia sp.]
MKTYTRQQLHDLVWSGPMREVAKTLELSDNGLRKNCVKAFVPLPPQGHWNKVHAGQKVKTSPLPPRPPGVSDTIQIGQWDYRQHQKELEETEPVAPIFDEPIENLRARVTRNIGVVLASKNLSPPHAAFRRQVEDDARKAAQSSWHTAIFSTALEKRRLRILQGLFYGLSRLDCSVTVQGQETRTIYVNVGHQNVSIGLERVANRRRVPDEQAVERLKFSIFKGYDKNTERASWVDSDEQTLESQLTSIAVEIIVAGEMQYREHRTWVYEEEVRRREQMRQEAIKKKLEQQKAERERLIKLEADRLKRLTDSAENYQRAQAIRAFVLSVVGSPTEGTDAARVSRWQKWALLQADKLDPIATGRIWDDVNDCA